MAEKDPARAAQAALCGPLGADTVLFFLLILLSVMLSFRALLVQRSQALYTAAGRPEGAAALPPVYPIKQLASILIVGALGFFLCLGFANLHQAEAGGDGVAQCSARTNAWAGLLVFAAALLRLYDLNYVEASRPNSLLEADILQD